MTGKIAYDSVAVVSLVAITEGNQSVFNCLVTWLVGFLLCLTTRLYTRYMYMHCSYCHVTENPHVLTLDINFDDTDT